MSSTSRIRFYDLEATSSRIDVRCQTTANEGANDNYELWFEFSDDLPVSSTSIAIALSTLCGRTYQQIEFSFPMANTAIPAIRELTQSNVTTSGPESYPSPPRRGNLLSFSGGFDSLAARALMPESTSLVSMDFGGRFARERAFFEKFDTLRVSTNVASTPLRMNSWSFMGIGSILAADYYRAAYHTFGGIIEASPDNLRPAPAAARNSTFPPFRAAGYENAPYVLGLTEVGTLMVLLRSAPHLVSESLMSVASPGEEKLYRKAVLAQLVADAIGAKVNLPSVPEPKNPHLQFGDNFAVDLLALYAINRTGDEKAIGMLRDVPVEIARAAKQLSMKFMERANPTLYENFPRELIPGLQHRLWEHEIGWYTEQDWRSISAVRELLAPFHKMH